MRRIMTILLDGALLFWVLAAGPFCWLLRDGLGPDAVSSHGVDAIGRFLLTFYWGPVLVGLTMVRLSTWRTRSTP